MFRRRNRGAEFRTLEATERYLLTIFRWAIYINNINKRYIDLKDEIELFYIFRRIGRGKRDTNSSLSGLISNIRPAVGASNPVKSLSSRPQSGIQ